MFPSTRCSITNVRAIGRPSLSVLSTQIRTLYFCGPKPGDHDPDLPISQHYHAHSRTTNSINKPPTTIIIPTPPARPATPTPTLRISATRICSQTERHTMPYTNKLETARKALDRLVAATYDDATNYNTAVVIISEIARLEAELRRGEIEGKHWQELQKVREDIQGLKNMWQRMERRIFRE
ncbi:unnamed protein product [Alternaria alternata]